jgi:phosphatidylglycerophosphate synthase
MSEQAPPPRGGLPRMIVDGFPKVRSWAGPVISDHISETIPKDRTLLDGFIVAALSISDFLDGLGAEMIGPTDYGRNLDRNADVNFVTSQQKALTANGEIPPIHLQLKYAREYAMGELRDWGAKHGKSTASLERGRQKTTVEMATLTAANSPLAQKPDLIRWGASLGTALSLTSFAETIFDYMKKDEAENTTDTARNSQARELTTGPATKLASWIHGKEPRLKPSHITHAGKRIVEAASVLALARPDHPVLPTTIYTFGSVLDGLDGAFARFLGQDSADGEKEDIKADLEQQLAALAAVGGIALRRGNMVAASNYAVALMTTALVSASRAEAESKGFIVAEGGIGTRLGRGVTVGVGMGLNRYQDAADIVSATLAAGNVNTILERRHVAKYARNRRTARVSIWIPNS